MLKLHTFNVHSKLPNLKACRTVTGSISKTVDKTEQPIEIKSVGQYVKGKLLKLFYLFDEK